MIKNSLIIFYLLVTFVLRAQTAPKHMNDLYNKIYNSMANGSVIKPKLVLIDDLGWARDKQITASYDPNVKTISIGQSFLNLTSKFNNDSANARAHVLCHELAHLFLNHGYSSVIGTGFASVAINKELKKNKKGLEDKIGELEADQWASFYAYISGFKTNSIAPRLLDSIYKYYNLSDEKLSSYPKLAERKKFANDASVKMNSMCEAFDFANMASIHGDYDLSIEIYNAIIQEGFKSREIISNLGTVSLLKAIRLMDTSETKFILPLQIDMNTRMHQEDVRGIINDDEINELLNRSIELFKSAINTDPDYGIAYLNLSIAYWLHKENKDSDYYLEKAKNKLSLVGLEKAKLFEAITMCHSGDKLKKEEGVLILKRMEAEGNMLAASNLHQVNESIPSKINTNTPEWIKNLTNTKLPTDFNNINILDSTFKKTPTLKCYENTGEVIARKWKLANNKYGSYLIVKQYIFNEVKTISDNDKNNLILLSQSIFETNNGTYLRFKDVIVILNSNNQAKYQILKK